jgi:glucosamine-6-phosphate deaminase
MEVVIVPAPAAVGSVAADAISSRLRRKPAAVIGVATGSSPLPVYRDLIARHRRGTLSFAAASAFLLDEYMELPSDHPASYRTYIEREFTGHVDFAPGAVHGPDGNAPDPVAACDSYEAEIRAAGGIDVQILGIGTDGHIAFNEPGSSLASRTRVKTLTARTRADNARFFSSPDEVPRHVLTQGVGTILEARHLLLVATGPGKAEPVARAVEGPIGAIFPATAIQLHPHVTVVIDVEAAAALTLTEYYTDAYAYKPSWQGL